MYIFYFICGVVRGYLQNVPQKKVFGINSLEQHQSDRFECLLVCFRVSGFYTFENRKRQRFAPLRAVKSTDCPTFSITERDGEGQPRIGTTLSEERSRGHPEDVPTNLIEAE